MEDFIENLDYSQIEEGAIYRFAPNTKWRCIACLGIDVYVFHLPDVPMGGVSDFFDLVLGYGSLFPSTCIYLKRRF